MTSLYEYGNQLAEIVDQVQALLEEGISPDDERVQELLERMVSGEADWESKALNCGKFLSQLSLDEKQVDIELDRLSRKKKNFANAYSNLHDLLLWQMREFGKTEIKSPILTIKVRENPISVVVKDESVIPLKFKVIKETVSIDKIMLKAANLEGAEIPGVEFVRTRKLSIK